MRKRTIIIGDIHGCLSEFKKLIQLVKYTPKIDRCICVGDLVDRGPDSSGVVRYAQTIGAEIVIGNHDDKYIRYRRHEQKKTLSGQEHYRNPINLTPPKQKVWETLDDNIIDILETGKYCILLSEYNSLVVHAGVIPGEFPEQRGREEYIYTRYIHKDSYEMMKLSSDFTKPAKSVHWTEVYDGDIDIVYGHDVQSFVSPTIRTNKKGARTIGIDTGACFGGRLTAMVLNVDGTEEFHHVQASKAWKEYRIVRAENDR